MTDSASPAPQSGSAPGQDGSHSITQPAERHALSLLVSHRPRNVGWRQAAGLLFGDWGTSRLYVLGLAFFFAPRTSLWLLAAMSFLLLAVGWAYTQICRVYPDGGGVYTAAKRVSRTLAVIGALLLFADYVVTASLSSLDAFHYFGLTSTDSLFALGSPGMWAMVAIVGIGAMNLLGPRHTGSFAIVAAAGMMFITLLISFFAMPQVSWAALPHRIMPVTDSPGTLWVHFVAIVLALSGVEAIGNLTGVMKKPVNRTSRKAIWLVAGEVALFNLILGIAMVSALPDSAYADHKEDMLAFLGSHFIGPWAELSVRVLGGVLLLSAVNTVVTDMISLQYLLSRDGELPQLLRKLNRFGVPWVGLPPTATLAPCVVLLVSHDLESLAALYAIGVVGAVAINITLVSLHPRMRGWLRKTVAATLGLFLVAIWVTLATTKLHALVFVSIVMVVGLTARFITRRMGGPAAAPGVLLRRAILEQLNADALTGRKVLLATAGSAHMAEPALAYAKTIGASLVVAFVREINLAREAASTVMSLDQDQTAQTMFAEFLVAGHKHGVTIIPMYDVGSDPAEQLAEAAAMEGVEEVLLGSSRRGLVHRMIKGSLQRRLETLLPREIRVHVLDAPTS